MSVLFGRPERRTASLGFFQQSSVIPPNSEAGLSGGVQPLSVESSLQKTAVWACVNLTATIAECMPVEVFAGEGDDKSKLPMPPWMADLGGDKQGLPDWIYQAIWSWMLRGNLYGLTPDGAAFRDSRRGTPTLIQLQHPDCVSVYQPYNAEPVEWRVMGREVPTRQVWHRRVFPVPGRLLGASPIELNMPVISLGVQVLQFGLRWFHDGAHPSGMLVNEERGLDKKQADTAKDRFVAALRGTREPLVLGKGWKYQQIQVAPNESQFLETNGWTAAECCRIFGPGYVQIFGYETGDSLTYANVEQRSLDMLTYAVDPWLVRMERMLSQLLPADQHAKFNRAGLLRTDMLTRYRTHEIALRNKIETVNEVRRTEDMPPVEWGDEPQAIAAPAGPPVPVSVEGLK